MIKSNKKADNTTINMEEGYLYYLKNGILKSKLTPEFGSVILKFSDSVLVHSETRTQEAH